jgi:hypothetical protein
VEAFNSRFLDGSVHPLDPPVGPRVVRFCKPVLDAVRIADHIEACLTRPARVAVAGLLDELDTIVGRYRVNAVGHGFN